MPLVTGPSSAIQPVQLPDMVGDYAKLAMLKNQLQEAPLRQQALQQQVQEGQQRLQGGQLALQGAQEKQQDDAALRAATADPANHGMTLGQIADGLASKGSISQTAWTAAKKADADARKEAQGWDTTQLDNNVKATAANKALLENVMSLPDDQIATNWPQIVQQYNSIPGNNKRPLNPQQPLTKEQIQQQGPLLALHQAYLDDELARREKKTAADTADVALQQKQQDLSYGPTGQAADAKYSFLQKKIASKQPVTADDQAWMKGYEKQKLLVPATSATIRMEGLGNTREYPVYDSKSKTTVMVTPMEINRAAKEEPGRYTAASYTPEAVAPVAAAKAVINKGTADELKAYQTAYTHADLLGQAADAINNGDTRMLNKVSNELGVQFGSDKTTNFRIIANAYTREVTKALSSGHLTDSEIKERGATMPDNASPEQFRGAVNAYKALMKSKQNITNTQVQNAAHGSMSPTEGGGSSAPKIGDIKKFPNGKTGKWDGTGWEAQ